MVAMNIHLKTAAMLCSLLLLSSGVRADPSDSANPSADAEPGVVTKVEHAIERGAKAAAHGIEHGVQAAASGVQRGAKATAKGVERGAKAAARGVEHGAKATQGAAGRVADKMAPASSSAAGK